jgi:hypothetical protein
MNDAPDERRLLELAALPAGDPRRAEAAKDPRVRAWLLEHDAFLEDVPLGPEEQDRVARAAESALARARTAAASTTGVVLELPRAARGRFGVPRWAAAAALVAVVGGVAVLAPRFASRDHEAFRSSTPGARSQRLVTLPAARDAAGRIVLRWQPLPSADAYRVEILEGLTAVATHDVVGADSLALDPAALPAGDNLLWRVLAMRDGAAIETSQPRQMPR